MNPSPSEKKIYLIRHGQTQWSLEQKHTGLTDLPLTKQGQEEVLCLKKGLLPFRLGTIFVSPLQRAKQTCEGVGLLSQATLCPELMEWNYGAYEGKTTQEIHQVNPNWNIFTHGAPQGETVQDISLRIQKMFQKIEKVTGNVTLFSSGHFLRAFAAVWIGLTATEGRLFALSTASLSILGFENGNPVMLSWNNRPLL